MKKVKNAISSMYCCLVGNFLSIFFYKRKYLKGKYFCTKKHFGITSLGWKWVISDCKSRIFLGENKGIPFPCSYKNTITNYKNIIFDIDDLNNFQGSGKYFQTVDNGKITIGKGTWIANNVGLITANHDPYNLNVHLESKSIVLGENCWIGMNAIILPGVILGPNTIVGAGSVVTKSFIEGNVVVAGNPAKIIKHLDINKKQLFGGK